MQFLTISSLLAASALANPLALSPRQPVAAATFTREISFSNDLGCAGASVQWSEDNKVANVSLPNNFVNLATRPQETRCHISLRVRFPVGRCTTGTAFGQSSGLVNIPQGKTATFNGRAYAISPSAVNATVNLVENGSWEARDGPINEPYTLSDNISWWYPNPQAPNDVINFTVQGGLQVQPQAPAPGFISNDRFIFDIRTQVPC